MRKRNEQIVADGMKPRRTIFQTQKQFLRDAINNIASHSKNLKEFKNGLQEKYHITLTERRGRFSYLHPERNKNITDRALETQCSRDYLLALFEQNKHTLEETQYRPETVSSSEPSGISTENKHSFFEYNPDYDYSSDPATILFIRLDLRLVVDLQNNVKACQSRAYAQKVKISHLQQMAKTIAYVQEHHYDIREILQMYFEEISEKYESAVKFLKEKNTDGKIPSMKSLKAEVEKLTVQRSAQYETYQYFKEYQKELRTVCSNVDSILRQPHLPGTEHSKNLDISK